MTSALAKGHTEGSKSANLRQQNAGRRGRLGPCHASARNSDLCRRLLRLTVLQVIVAVLPQEFRIHGAENEARHTFRALQSTNSVRSRHIAISEKANLAGGG